MALIEINTNPSRRQLAVFGAAWLVLLAAVGAVVYLRTGSLIAAGILWAAAVVVPGVGWIVPAFMRIVYVALAYAAFPIGWAVSTLLLAAVYYLLLTPAGLLMRLLGRDHLRRRFDPQAGSYWLPHRHRQDLQGYFRQF